MVSIKIALSIKRQLAETHLINSGLTYTIFRPSVIFGDPHGRWSLQHNSSMK